MKTYINEGHIKGDVVNLVKSAKQMGEKAAVLYTIVVKVCSRYKEKINEKNIAIDFWRMDEDKDIELIGTGDHIFIWYRLDSKLHEGRFFTSVKGYHYQLLEEPEFKKENGKAEVEKPRQAELSSDDNDEDLPF